MKKDVGMVMLFLIAGAVIGGLLGELLNSIQSLSGITPYLVKNYTIIDIPPVAIDLYILKIIVGLSLHPNMISILGAIFAILLFRRL